MNICHYFWNRQSMDITVFVDMSAVWHISTHWNLSFWHISTCWDLSSTKINLVEWEISTGWNVLKWEISTGWNVPEWEISTCWDMPNSWHIYKYRFVHWLFMLHSGSIQQETSTLFIRTPNNNKKWLLIWEKSIVN